MADVILVCLGNTRMMEGEEGDAMLNTDGGDRADIRLPQSQREFIRLLREKAPDKPVIAVITGGSAIALQDVMEVADAVLFAWYPGEQGGMALADIVFGKVNPSGRLPVTFFRSVEDLPAFDDYSMKGRTYKYFEGEPLFEFGFGLSYTTFECIEVGWEKHIFRTTEKIPLKLIIRNTGPTAGEEVVMVFAAREKENTGDQSMTDSPVIGSLIGFGRVALQSGETRTIFMEFDLQDLHHWDSDQQQYTVDKGAYVFGLAPAIHSSHNSYLGRIMIE
jgi:beta-glucosidase